MKFDEQPGPPQSHRPAAPEVVIPAPAALLSKSQPAATGPESRESIPPDAETLLMSGLRVLERCVSSQNATTIDKALLAGAAALFKSLAEACESIADVPARPEDIQPVQNTARKRGSAS